MYAFGMGASRGIATIVCGSLLFASTVLAQDPWADQVVSYDAGSGADVGYTDPLTALGEPSRMTGTDPWEAAVTPFNGPWLTEQVVSIGAGGHLTVRFDEPIIDDPSHPFGVDLIVFGNGFFADANWPDGVVGGWFEDGPFTVSVSADGVGFEPLPGTHNDALFPMLGYLDLTGPYDTEPGSILSDFTKPVDPSLTYVDFDGLTFDQILALYDGSGGGIPLDIASTGLNEVYYVRIDVPDGATSPDFDALAVVPEPSTAFLLCSFVLARALRRG
jgi:hypothetical protein